MQNGKHALTILELLVVITVIAALAGLTIFSFGSWRLRTAQTEMKNELNTAAATLKSYRNFNNIYPATLAGIPYTPSTGVTLTYTLRSGGASYCLNAGSVAVPSAPHWYVDSNNGMAPTTTSCS